MKKVPVLAAFFLLMLTACESPEGEKKENDPLLTNSRWRLLVLNNEPVPPGGPELYFDHESNLLSGSSGCNKLTGTYEIESDHIELAPSLATRFICFGKETDEKEFIQNLGKTDSLAIRNDTLKLFSDRELVAVFTKN